MATIKTINIRDTIKQIILRMEVKGNGIVEKAIISSMEWRKSFQKDHFVSPVIRWMFLYSNHFILKPIQPQIPLEKQLYSFKDKSELSTVN